MKLQPINFYKSQTFKGATFNINAFSDTHGELLLANNALEEMRRLKSDIFCPQEKGKTNITAICGDWFMDGAKKCYITKPNQPNGIFQLKMFNELMNQIRTLAPDNIAFFTPGNHDFDGGVELLSQIFQHLNAQILMTNLDLENSPAFEKSIDGINIVSKKIVEAEDDKRPDLTHKILFLGISPVNLVSYQKNLTGVTLLDNINKGQADVKEEDYQRTLDFCEKEIKNFKAKNPQGGVVLMSHTGVNFADNLARRSTVDLIFDGHEHKEDIRIVNGTPIVPLSQNFKRLINAKIEMDDEGKLKSINLKTYFPLGNKTQGPLSTFFNKLFAKDIEPVFSLQTPNPDIELLDIQNIRAGNNYLANFVTDSILEEIRKKDPSVDFFALNASAIRRGLKVSKNAGISHFDINNVLSGIRSEDGQIMTTQVSGKELIYLVKDNILFNQQMPQKNPLTHYSGLIINRRSILDAIKNNEPLETLAKFITDNNTGECISLDSTYKIANTEKYFNKSKNPVISKLKERSTFLGCSVQELFKEHFVSSNGKLNAKCDIRIK